MTIRPFLAPAMITALFVAGCTSQRDFPSLAPRAIESKAATAAPAPPAPPVLAASDSVRLSRVSSILSKARSGQAGFGQAYGAAERAVKSAGARGTDRWAEAQMAVSRLERAQGPVESAMADLDEEKRILMFAPPSIDQPIVDSAWSEIDAINQRQHAALRSLINQISRR